MLSASVDLLAAGGAVSDPVEAGTGAAIFILTDDGAMGTFLAGMFSWKSWCVDAAFMHAAARSRRVASCETAMSGSRTMASLTARVRPMYSC